MTSVTILAISLSSEQASVALLLEDQVLQSCTESHQGASQHSRWVLPALQHLLQQGQRTLSDCQAIAFDCGPGSFTGVRTACGIAQGLGFALDIPVIPVGSLCALAEQYRLEQGGSNVLVAIDARMGEVYWAQYCFDGIEWHESAAPQLSAMAHIVPNGGDNLCLYGSGFVMNAFSQLPNRLKDIPVVGNSSDVVPHASIIAHMAAIDFVAGRILAAQCAQPVYLRNRVAQTLVERLSLWYKISLLN